MAEMHIITIEMHIISKNHQNESKSKAQER